MEVVVVVGFAILIVGLLVLIALLWHRYHMAREAAWRTAATRLGLHYQEGGLLRGRQIVGQIDGMPVVVDTYTTGSSENSQTWTRVVVELSGRVPPHTALGAESFWTRNKVFGGADIEVGDPAFDAAVRVHGDPVWTRAIFGAETRRVVQELVVGHKVKLSDGQLSWQKSGVLSDAREIVQAVQSLASAGQRLTLDRRMIASALRHNATRDPASGVRHHALATLLGSYPGSRESIEAARGASTDPSPVIRLLGASSMGREGIAALEELMFGDYEFPPATLAQVFARAAAVAAPAQREALVLRALHPEHVEFWAVAADAAGQYGVTAATASLRTALDRVDPGDTPTAPALVRALGALGDTASEARMLALIDCEVEHTEVAAIEALGYVGRLSAVEPLLPKSRGVFTAGDIKNAARTAIAAIQARHGGGADGALSVVESQGVGDLSVVEPVRRGRLAVVEQEDEEEQGA